MRRFAASAALFCAFPLSLTAQFPWSAPARSGAKSHATAAAQTGTQTTAQTTAQTTLQTGTQTGTQAPVPSASQDGTSAVSPAGQLPLGGGYEPLGTSQHTLNPVTQPDLSPGVIHLLELEGKFADAVAREGGKAFSAWFADDAVTLANGKPPVTGRLAIAAQAQWDPASYQLSWVAEGARMGPSGDMGFTWGQYTGTAKDGQGGVVTTTGRYMTVWKKLPGGDWKVALEASADNPEEPGACCALPKP
jgi:ketosteroid isomerase-like protein